MESTKLRRRWRFLLAFLALFACGAIGIPAYLSSKAEAETLADLKALEEMGVPTTVADLAELGGNDTETLQIYAEAASKLKPTEEAWKKLAIDYAAWDPGFSDAKKKSLIEGCEEAIPLIEKAAARESFSFGRDWSKVPDRRFPEYWRLRIFAWIMLGEAERAAKRNEVGETTRFLKAADAIKFHFLAEPTLGAYIQAARIDNGVVNAICSALWNFRNDPVALGKLQNYLNSRKPFPGLRRALIGNLAIGRMILSSRENLLSHVDLKSEDWGERLADSYLSSGQIRAAAEQRLITTARKLFQGLPSNTTDVLGYEQPLVDLEKEFDSTAIPSNITHSLMWLWIDDLVEVSRMRSVRQNFPEIVFLLLREQAKTGKLPDKLPDYGDLTIDPFTGGQLTYKVVGKGFYLYSFGPDKMDDGGNSGDIALRVHG